MTVDLSTSLMAQLSGQVNVSAMWAFFLLHLTYRHFRFLISWPAGYLCLGKRSQWSIKDHPGRECIYVFDIQCWAILLAIEKYFHRSWHEWFHRQVCLPIGVRRICICFKFRSASHCDLLLVIGKVIGLIDNLWVHAGAMLSWVISQGGQQKRTMQKLKKTNQKLMLDLKHLSLKTPNDQVPLLIFTRLLLEPAHGNDRKLLLFSPSSHGIWTWEIILRAVVAFWIKVHPAVLHPSSKLSSIKTLQFKYADHSPPSPHPLRDEVKS